LDFGHQLDQVISHRFGVVLFVATHEPVRHLSGGIPVLTSFAVEHVQPCERVQDQACGWQSSRECLALPRNRTNQKRRPHQRQDDRPVPGVPTERDRPPRIPPISLHQRRRQGRPGVGVTVGHPQRDPPGVAADTAYTFGNELYLVDRQRGRQRLPMLDHIGRLAGGRQVDRDRPPLALP
jgi:hypothetical protein